MDEAVLRQYDPSWRERLVNFLMGDSRPSPERRRFAEGIGSLAGFTPAGIPLAANEVQRARDSGSPTNAAVAALGMLPVPAGRAAVVGAREMIARNAARAEQAALPRMIEVGEARAANGPGPWFTPGSHFAPPAAPPAPPWALGPGLALRTAIPLTGLAAALPNDMPVEDAPASTAQNKVPDILARLANTEPSGSPVAPVSAVDMVRRNLPPPAAAPPRELHPAVAAQASAPAAPPRSILDRIFSGQDYQSADPRNERPNLDSPLRRRDGSVNWGDADSAADFVRADRASHGYAGGGYASGGPADAHTAALHKAMDIIHFLHSRG